MKKPKAGGSSSFKNIQTCGSPWKCPCCAPKKRQEYARKIEAVVAKHLADGGGVLHWVGTMPHDGVDRLADLLDVEQDAWSAITSGRKRQEIWSRFGVDGYVRSLDVTVSPRNGWHPHFHTLFLTAAPLSKEQTEAFEKALYDVWKRKIQDGGYRTPHRTHCRVFSVQEQQHARTVGEYLGMGPLADPEVLDRPEPEEGRTADPSAIGLEMARHDLKTAGRGRGRSHLTPFQILDKVKDELDWGGESEELDWLCAKWREYEDATLGKRSIQTSHALWKDYGVDDDQGDGDGDEQDEEWVEVPMCAWREMARVPGGRRGCLEAAEGKGAVRLDENGFLVAVGVGQPCSLERYLQLMSERYQLRQWGVDPPSR